jgi:hypothetical protein
VPFTHREVGHVTEGTLDQLGLAAPAVPSSLWNTTLFCTGAILVTFGLIARLYRCSQSLLF